MTMKLIIFIIIAGITIYWIIKHRSRSQSPTTPTSHTSQKAPADTSEQTLIPKFSITVETKEPEKHKVETSINGKRLEIISPTIDESSSDVSWIGVVFEGKHYVYGYEIEKWVYSRADVTPGPPPQETEIVSAIKNAIDKFRPNHWKENCIKTIYRNKGKKQYSVKGEVNVNECYHDLWAYMDYNTTIFSIPISDYLSIYCNFHTNYYDFPDRTKHMEKAVLTWLSKEYAYYKNH